MTEIIALAKKDLLYLVRDKAGLFFVFGFPVLFAVFFGMIFSGMGGGDANAIGVVIVDDDGTPQSESFAAKLRDHDALDVVPFSENPEIAGTLQERAMRAVRAGDVAAFIRLTPGFGAARDNMFQGESVLIEIGVDPSRGAEGAMLEGIVAELAYQRISELFSDPVAMREQTRRALEDVQANASPAARMVLMPFLNSLDAFADGLDELQEGAAEEEGAVGGFNPVTIDRVDVLAESEREFSVFEISFPQGLVWGLMSAAFTFGLSLVIERTRGTLLRLQIAPISTRMVLAGKALACFVLVIGLSVAMLIFGAVGFGVRPDSMLHLSMAVVSMGVCWVGLMMLIAVSGKTEAAVGGIGWAVLIVMAMIGGGMIPRPFMPEWMNTVGIISPIRWSHQALEGALWRDYSTGDMLLPCAVLVGIGVGGFALGARIFDWTTTD